MQTELRPGHFVDAIGAYNTKNGEFCMSTDLLSDQGGVNAGEKMYRGVRR